MDGCQWQMRLRSIGGEIDEMRESIDAKLKELEGDETVKKLRSKIRAGRKKIRNTRNKLLVSMLEEEEEGNEERLRVHSEQSGIGDCNLILGGLKELEAVLQEKKENSKRPKSNLQFVMWKAIKTRAGGGTIGPKTEWHGPNQCRGTNQFEKLLEGL